MTTRRRSSTVQSLVFPRAEFTPREARTWAREHGYRASAVDRKANTLRLRQLDPDQCVPGSYRTFPLGSSGVQATACRPWSPEPAGLGVMAPGYRSRRWTLQDWRSVVPTGAGLDTSRRCGAPETRTPDDRPALCLPRAVIETLEATRHGHRILADQARAKWGAAAGERVPWHPEIRRLHREVAASTPADDPRLGELGDRRPWAVRVKAAQELLATALRELREAREAPPAKRRKLMPQAEADVLLHLKYLRDLLGGWHWVTLPGGILGARAVRWPLGKLIEAIEAGTI